MAEKMSAKAIREDRELRDFLGRAALSERDGGVVASAESARDKACALQQKERSDDKYLQPFKHLCWGWRALLLGLHVKFARHDDGTRFGVKIVDRQNRQFWWLSLHAERMEGNPSPEEVRAAIEKEWSIRRLRKASADRVIALARRVKEQQLSRKISVRTHNGLLLDLLATDAFAFGSVILFAGVSYEWCEGDLRSLEKAVEGEIAAQSDALRSVEAVLSKMELAGACVFVRKTWNERWGETGALVVNDTEVLFPTLSDAHNALGCALGKGAYLPHHHELPLLWRDVAKSEQWTPECARFAQAVLDGDMLRVEENARVGFYGRGSSTSTSRRYSMFADVWCLGDVRVHTSLGMDDVEWIRAFATRAGRTIVDQEDAVREAQARIQANAVLCVRVSRRPARRRQQPTILFEGKGGVEDVMREVRDAVSEIDPLVEGRQVFMLSIKREGYERGYGLERTHTLSSVSKYLSAITPETFTGNKGEIASHIDAIKEEQRVLCRPL